MACPSDQEDQLVERDGHSRHTDHILGVAAQVYGETAGREGHTLKDLEGQALG